MGLNAQGVALQPTNIYKYGFEPDADHLEHVHNDIGFPEHRVPKEVAMT